MMNLYVKFNKTKLWDGVGAAEGDGVGMGVIIICFIFFISKTISKTFKWFLFPKLLNGFFVWKILLKIENTIKTT